MAGGGKEIVWRVLDCKGFGRKEGAPFEFANVLFYFITANMTKLCIYFLFIHIN